MSSLVSPPVASPPPASILDRLRAWLAAPLDGNDADTFASEAAEQNRRRLRVLLSLTAVGHLLHVAAFHTSASDVATLSPQTVLWRNSVAATHLLTFFVTAPLAVITLRARPDQAPRSLGMVVGLLYVLHGAVISGVDQLTLTAVTPFIGYCLGAGVVLALSPREAVWVFSTALVSFVAAILTMQPSPSVRLAVLPNGLSIVALSMTLSFILFAARRRDFLLRRTIDRQQETLATLNQTLERRVDEQVAEIVSRANEVERLNTQLHAQVRARSAELSLALAKLASERHDDGKLRQGVVLGDRFEIQHLLGEGGMGAVYAGLDREANAPVAIKVIQASSSHQLDALRRFLREAQTVATVEHPAVVRMVHVDVSDDGMLYQVQERVIGDSLQSRLRAGSPWKPEVVARLGSVLAEALAAAHAQGIIHRDVKPANMMLTRVAPGLRLLDFGIAKLFQDAQQPGATETGAILGTPAFMAPEQVDDSRRATDRVDVYAVGVMLFVMLTGKYPFEQDTPIGTLVRRVIAAAPDVRTVLPSIPDDLAEIVSRCLAKSPDDRPSAAELTTLLAGVADRAGLGSLEALEIAGSLHGAGAADLPPTVVVMKKPALGLRPIEPISRAGCWTSKVLRTGSFVWSCSRARSRYDVL